MSLSQQGLINRLSFRQLQVFMAVYQQKGYGRAADLLGLTQPAVSAQIRQLETALEVKLFEFVGRKLYCTTAGELVARTARAVFEQVGRLQNDVEMLEGLVSGQLRLAVVNTAQYVVPYLLKPFLERYPEVDASIQVVNRARALERLEENLDDLVIMGLVPAQRSLSSLPFLDNELVPVVPAGHPLATQAQVSVEDFFSYPLVMREQGSGSRLALEQYCQQARVHPRAGLEVGSNDVAKHTILAGLGVGVLPRLSIVSELQLGKLRRLELAGFPLRRSWCLVYPAGKSPSLVSRRFQEYVQQNLADIARQFAQMADPGLPGEMHDPGQ